MSSKWVMSGAVMEAHSRHLGLQCGNSVGRAVFLLKGQACHGILPNEDLPDQNCRQLRCRRCWSRQDSAHGHSQTQRLLFWTVFAVALGPNEACREEPVRCVRICQRDKRYHKLTGFPGTDADSCCCGSLSMRSCCRHSDIIDAVGRQVFKQVGVDRCRDGQVNVLPSSGVVIIQLIAGDWVRADCVRGSPLQLYRRRRHRFTTQITRLLRHYKQHNSLQIFR